MPNLTLACVSPGDLACDGDRLELIVAAGHNSSYTCDTLDIWMPRSQDGRVTFYRDGGLPFPHEMLR